MKILHIALTDGIGLTGDDRAALKRVLIRK